MTAEKLRPFWNNLLALPVADTATAYIRAQHDLAQVRITLERERMQILQPSITDADWEWRSAQEIAMLVPEAERPALVKKLRREGNAKRLSADCYRKVKRNEDDDRLAHQPDHLYRSAHPEVRALIAEYLPK